MIIADSFFRSLDVRPAVHGSTKAIFRRVERFHEALVFMILRGDKALLAGYTFTPKEQPPQLIPGTFFSFYPLYFTHAKLFSSSTSLSTYRFS
jgi:hypothetical protein